MLGFYALLCYNNHMSKTQSFTKDELNNLSKDAYPAASAADRIDEASYCTG